MRWMLQHVEPARDRAEAETMADGLRAQDGCVVARVIGDGRTKPYAAQGFFEDVPDAAWLPEGTRRVVVPLSLLK